MTEMNYKPRKPSKIMKLFWKAAGGDEDNHGGSYEQSRQSRTQSGLQRTTGS